MNRFSRTIIAGSIFFSTLSFGKVFKTQFVSLDLPPNWSCQQEELDWVCQPDNLAERSEALVVIVTKSVNEVDDTLDKYLEILQQPKDMRDLLGTSYKSKIKYSRKREIRSQQWVDSLHLGSELPGFYTRYVASTKEKVAALVSYSIGESVYAKWAAPMDQMIDSLDIFFDPAAFAELQKQSPMSLLGSRGAKGGLRGLPKAEDEETPAKKEGEGFDPTMLGGIILVAAAAGYLIYKKKKG